MADVSVRPARPADAAAVADVQVLAWRTGYARILPAEVLSGLDAAAVADSWRAAAEAPPTARHALLVALSDQSVRGFAAVGPATDDDARGTAELLSLLVAPDAQRQGHGSRLLAACVDTWRLQTYREAVAWAFAADRVLTDFLTGSGWAPDGSRRGLQVGAEVLEQVRLHTTLG